MESEARPDADADAETLFTNAAVNDPPELSALRPIFDRLTGRPIGEGVELSNAGTNELDISRKGFTYGETGLVTLMRVLEAADLPSFCCVCIQFQGSAEAAAAEERCGLCDKRQRGARITDCGSGTGNLVVGACLLVAAGLARASRVRGVELLPTLHGAAASTLREMRAQFAAAASSGHMLLPLPLPSCDVVCADLASHDLSDVDILYLCSTAFTPELVASFASHAAHELRPGSRVITLSRAISHPAFELERCMHSCRVSWGAETAYVHRKLSTSWLDAEGRLLTKGVAGDGQATQWTFVTLAH